MCLNFLNEKVISVKVSQIMAKIVSFLFLFLLGPLGGVKLYFRGINGVKMITFSPILLLDYS